MVKWSIVCGSQIEDIYYFQTHKIALKLEFITPINHALKPWTINYGLWT